ncbi:hypothetical protein MVEN_00817900 [Mycena venus]|uniref:Uncharacterized protein n=1 Tax=Mycena venus TaxID=2733690 RepID=A0A8H6YB15_9AGAR|nr:hypothetical protein MVEN_00817900 [Mycena venus]
MASSVVSSSVRLHKAGQGLMFYILGLVVQTFVFGAYTILIWMSTRMLLARKLNTRVNQVMFGITTFMYVLSAAYWCYSVADGVDRMYEYIALAVNPFRVTFDHTEVTKWSPLFNAVMLINYVLSDGVVVWRAWVICLRNHRKYLWITMVFLALTALTVILTIAFRIAGVIISPINNLPKDSILGQGVDILQVATLATSLLSNFTATGVVAATAWGHWRTIRSAFSEGKAGSLRTNRILLLVVETGVLYCISALTVLAASLIRLPQGTLGDLYTPVNVQLAGAYPTIVLLLVSTKKSLSESSFTDDDFSSSGSGSAASQPIRFAKLGTNSTGTTASSEFPKPIHFARNPAMSGTDSVIMDISSSRPSTEKFGRQNRLSDDTFV